MVQMKVHRMLSFGCTNDSGNTPIVIENSSMSNDERLPFAQQQDAGAAVFLETNPLGEKELDYYYSHTRSPYACTPPLQQVQSTSTAIQRAGRLGLLPAYIANLVRWIGMSKTYT